MKNRQVMATRRGGPGVLEVKQSDAPRPGESEVLVRVKAAGVAYADIMMREGVYPGGPEPPFTPGYDIVGEVAATGEGADRFEPGRAVAALTVTGGYADYICVRERNLVPMPGDLDPAGTVSLVLNYLTAWQMMFRSAHLERDGRVLVHGAAGGVGTAVLQIAGLHDIEAWGTASAPKHDTVRAYGGRPIDYRNEDFVERMRELAPEGVDAVLDPIGGRHLGRSFECLSRGGTLVAFGFYEMTRGGSRRLLAGLKEMLLMPKFNPMNLIGDSRAVAGYSVTGMRAGHPDWYHEDLARLLDLLAEGKLAPVVAERLPLEQAGRAHEFLGGRKVAGKIVLLTGS